MGSGIHSTGTTQSQIDSGISHLVACHFISRFSVKDRRPSQLRYQPDSPAAKGEPPAVESAPVLSIMCADMLLPTWFATQTNLSVGSIAIAWGLFPAGNGEPRAAASAPVSALIVYPDMLLPALFATWRNSPTEPTAIPQGPGPAVKGELMIAASAPVVGLILYAEVEAPPLPQGCPSRGKWHSRMRARCFSTRPRGCATSTLFQQAPESTILLDLPRSSRVIPS
jgi:hypothetical protein